MQEARFRCTRALIKVTRILMQDGGQNRSTNHDVGEVVGVDSSKSLPVTLQSLLILRVIAGLIGEGEKTCAGKRHRIDGNLQCQLKFQLGSKRHGVVVVDGIEVGDKTKDPL